ncbi:MAG TPA: aspartate kinase, partial [Bacteroidota bacterium]
MIVAKFGGTSVQDAAAIQNVSSLVRRETRPTLVIVSACAGVTNSLLFAATVASGGDRRRALLELHALSDRHRGIARQLLPGGPAGALEQIDKDEETLQELLKGLAALKELTPRALDQCLTFGEQWSSLLLFGTLKAQGHDVGFLDVRDVMITNADHTKALPDLPLVEERSKEILAPLLNAHAIVVTQGFLGRTPDGNTTTIGRGGSDYTAAILGAALDAEEIQIWTDVDGILTADPSVIPEARNIQTMTFSEASELAYFGAKVLHPSTILPAISRNIPVRVLNSTRPDLQGTLVTADDTGSQNGAVKSIAYKEGISVVTIQSTRMLMSYGFLATVFEVFARYKKSVDVVATSEVGVSLTVDNADLLENLVRELEGAAEVTVEHQRAVMCVVGEGIRRTQGVAAAL